MEKSKTSWIVAGGKIGEYAHCTRCGEGLELGPQPVYIVTAAWKAFIKAHRYCKEGQYTEPKSVTPREWLHGRDTGTSSLTIFSVLMNARSPHNRYDIPYDPSDFGRCYRLLELFPDWKPRLPEVSARFPEWIPFVREWDTLTEMYETAMKTPDAPASAMYNLMCALRKEGKNGRY